MWTVEQHSKLTFKRFYFWVKMSRTHILHMVRWCRYILFYFNDWFLCDVSSVFRFPFVCQQHKTDKFHCIFGCAVQQYDGCNALTSDDGCVKWFGSLNWISFRFNLTFGLMGLFKVDWFDCVMNERTNGRTNQKQSIILMRLWDSRAPKRAWEMFL